MIYGKVVDVVIIVI